MSCSIVPPYLLDQIARAPRAGQDLDPGAADACRHTRALDDEFRAQRQGTATPVAADDGWTVHTADNTETLPGEAVRSKGDPAAGDAAVDEAYDGVESSLALFREVYDHPSYDGASAHVMATVHYGQAYANAFWDGAQLVFGDGDGKVFGRFTRAVDVLAHEFTHAVTQHVSGLVYESQSGAVNESVSDVFATCLKQTLLGQTAAEGDWLIGAELFLEGIEARGLRDMANPGTAYDDPVLGKDPQGADMSEYVETTDDNGGVHLNSGIPNRAFHLAAVAIGGSAAEGAGRIWWKALQEVPADVDFAGFAAATVRSAGEHADAVRTAWETVGVTAATGGPDPAPAPEAGPEVVEVRRSGGFVGRTVTGRFELTGSDTRTEEVRGLLQRVDLHAQAPGKPHPDMFMFTIVVGNESVTLSEQQLTGDLKRLTSLVLDQ